MSHTPGNWNWHTSNSWRRLCSDHGHGKQVPVLTPTINPQDAMLTLDVACKDMALIAAAPDLYAACKAIEVLCCEKAFSTTELEEVLKLACGAIAKAEGR